MNRQEVFDVAAVRSIIAERKGMAGAMLPILHGIQERIGYIPADSVPMIAGELNVSRAEVQGVLSFYHFFRQQPPGKHVLQLCRAEACQARGSEVLADQVQALLGCAFHETTADGSVTLEPVYCLGQCACGPNVMLDQQLHARVGFDKLQRLLQAKRGA